MQISIGIKPFGFEGPEARFGWSIGPTKTVPSARRAQRGQKCHDEVMATRIKGLWSPPVLFAHRGARAQARDNTIEAFQLALRLGATGLETDAWCTRDGAVVLDHDGWHRWFPRKWIAGVDRDALRDHIPTLGEFYEAVGTEYPLSIDVKDADVFQPLVEVARAHGAEAQLWLCHPDLDLLCSWRDDAPEVSLVNSTSLDNLPDGPERRAAELSAAGIDAMNLRQGEWTGGLTTLFHRFDLLCFGWDAQHEHQLARLIDMGIDAVYSDYSDRMAEVARLYE